MKVRISPSGQTTQYVADFRHGITEEYRVNKDFEVGGVGAGRIFTESYDVKVEGENAGKTKEETQVQNLPTDTHPVLRIGKG